MSGFIWVDAAWNSLCGFCVREVFERKHEREKEKSLHSSFGKLLLSHPEPRRHHIPRQQNFQDTNHNEDWGVRCTNSIPYTWKWRKINLISSCDMGNYMPWDTAKLKNMIISHQNPTSLLSFSEQHQNWASCHKATGYFLCKNLAKHYIPKLEFINVKNASTRWRLKMISEHWN